MVESNSTGSFLARDLIAGVVVFLVALPLCLGIALASGAPLFSGLVAGIVGGLVVGSLSGSATSVSGPAAGLAAIVLAEIARLGTFEAFLLAVMFSGFIQLLFGALRAGNLSSFVPTSVIKGLLAAIGVILILKQIPHVFGHDSDPEGEMSFQQPDGETTFSELFAVVDDIHIGATIIGLASIVLIILWNRIGFLKNGRLPAPLAVVTLGLILGGVFSGMGDPYAVGASHLVQVPVAEGVDELGKLLRFPDWSQWSNPDVYVAAVTIAIVASLETLLNLEAVDRLDPEQRHSPPNRELFAQGGGNIVSGLLGGLPITSVIIRGSVNVHSGAKTKLSAIWHGVLLVSAVLFLPTYINKIPLACLAAILLNTGFKLASPKLIRKMYRDGWDQFIPFAVTVVAIVGTDLLVGLGIGFAVSLCFILSRQFRRPVRQITEKHIGGEVLHIELPEQVTFLNQTGIDKIFEDIPNGSHVLLNAEATDYIDPDVLALIREYRDERAPARGVQLSMVGFNDEYELKDEILFVDYSTLDLQERVTPAQALEILRKGNERYVSGQRLNRGLARKIGPDTDGDHPLAVVLSGVDARTSMYALFDTGISDLVSVRVAGNVVSPRVLGSMEYAATVGGVRLIIILGKTRCDTIKAALYDARDEGSTLHKSEHFALLLSDLENSIDKDELAATAGDPDSERAAALVDQVARRNVEAMVTRVTKESQALARLVEQGRVAVVGAMYDTTTGAIEFMEANAIGLDGAPRSST